MKKFEELKLKYDEKYGDEKEIKCILPVHLSTGKVENSLFKKKWNT